MTEYDVVQGSFGSFVASMLLTIMAGLFILLVVCPLMWRAYQVMSHALYWALRDYVRSSREEWKVK